MSIQFQENKISYTSNGVVLDYNFNFKLFDESHLKVLKVYNDVTTTLSLGTDYTLSVDEGEGGVLTLLSAAETGAELTLIRSTPVEQDLEISQDFVDTKQLENKLDYGRLIDQDLDEKISRALTFPETATTFETKLPEPTFGDVLSWGVSRGLENLTLSPVATSGSYNDLSGTPDLSIYATVGQALANTTSIATNAVNINTNSSDILSNETNISINADEIINNANDIAINQANITANSNAIPTELSDLSDINTSGGTVGQALALNGSGQYVPTTIAGGSGGGAVDSVNGQTGAVVLTSTDVGLGNADNTSDLDKPISTLTQSELDLKVNTGDLSAVATSGSYNDLTDTPAAGGGDKIEGTGGKVVTNSADMISGGTGMVANTGVYQVQNASGTAAYMQQLAGQLRLSSNVTDFRWPMGRSSKTFTTTVSQFINPVSMASTDQVVGLAGNSFQGYFAYIYKEGGSSFSIEGTLGGNIVGYPNGIRMIHNGEAILVQQVTQTDWIVISKELIPIYAKATYEGTVPANTPQFTTNVEENINYDSLDALSSDSVLLTSGGEFSIFRPGRYNISASAMTDTVSWADGQVFQTKLYFRENGTTTDVPLAIGDRQTTMGSGNGHKKSTVSGTFDVPAVGWVRVTGVHNQSSTVGLYDAGSSDLYNYITISEVV